MSDNPNMVNVPLEMTDNFDEIIRKAQETDAVLQRLKRTASEIFQGATGFPMGTAHVQNPQDIGPQFVQAMQSVQQRQSQVAGAVRAGQPIPEWKEAQQEAAKQQQEATKQRKQLTDDELREQWAQLRRRQQLYREEDAQRQSVRQSLMALARPSSLSGILGALAMGGGNPGQQVSAGIVSALTYGVASGRASNVGSAIGRTVGGALGLGEAGLGAAATAGGAVAGLGLLGVGTLLFGNNQAAQVAQADAQFRANIGGARGLSDQGINSFTSFVAHRAAAFQYDRQQGFDVAGQLGLMGVPLGGANGIMGAGGRGGALSAVLAASRQSQTDPTQMAQLFGSMMAVGGQTLQQTIKAFRELDVQAGKTNIPLGRMIQSVASLQAATGGAAVNAAGLSAIQAMVGPGVNAGSLIAPLVGATGAQSLAFSGMLGLGVNQFQSMQFGANGKQGNPLGLMQAVGSFLRRSVGSSATPQNIALGETLLQGTGMLNMQGVAPVQQAEIVRALLTGQTSKAAQLQSQVQGYRFTSTEDWQNQMIQQSANQTDVLQQIAHWTQATATDAGILAAQFGPKPSAIDQAAANWTQGSPPPRGYHIETRPVPGRGNFTHQVLVPNDTGAGEVVGGVHGGMRFGPPAPPHFPSGEGVKDNIAWSSGRDTFLGGSSGFSTIQLHLTGTFTGSAGTLVMDPISINHPVNLGRRPVGYSNETPRPLPPRPKFGRGP